MFLRYKRSQVEQSAPQALIYGWGLLVGYAVIPHLLARLLPGSAPIRQDGSWLSLVTVHAGALLLWAGIVVEPYRAPLHGAAYLAWMVSLLPILTQVWQSVRAGLAQPEPGDR